MWDGIPLPVKAEVNSVVLGDAPRACRWKCVNCKLEKMDEAKVALKKGFVVLKADDDEDETSKWATQNVAVGGSEA